MAAAPMTLGRPPRHSSAFLFFFLPFRTAVKDVLVCVCVCVYTYDFIRIPKIMCRYIPGPHVPHRSELGPWGLG
jgi:hypothetical protein